jgi:hypothetical protein
MSREGSSQGEMQGILQRWFQQWQANAPGEAMMESNTFIRIPWGEHS